MSAAYESAAVGVFVADYAGADAAGKINAIGLGFTTTLIQPGTGQTAPMYVVVLIDVPLKIAGQQAAVSLVLRNVTDQEVVKVAGPSGAFEALQIAQTVTFEKPSIAGLSLPDEHVVRQQMTIAFPMGLPLSPGKTYLWKLSIDGQSRQSWAATFSVPAPPPGPVFGGHAGPADIPNIAPIDTPEPEG